MTRRALLLLTLLPAFLLAKPTGPDVAQGTAVFAHPTKNKMQIITGDQTIINWDDFSIDTEEMVQFVMPNAHSTVLNRVTSQNASHLMGTLKGNGKIFLLNPNGILIGPDGVIDTNGFISSTLDVLDSEFLSGGDLRFRANSESKIVNLGNIHARDGDVALIGRYVENSGVIKAPNGTVSLAVGKEILLKPSGEERIFICALSQEETKRGTGIKSLGSIEALRVRLLADGNPYKLAINHEGKIDATKIEERNGEIYLVAENGLVEVHGEMTANQGEIRILGETVAIHETALIDVSSDNGGGNIFIGGSYQGMDPTILNSHYTFIHPEATIRANSLLDGDGGLVVIWSDGYTHFHGLIESRGGKNGGDGGLVEVSGKRFVDIHGGEVDRSAPSGNPGKLLLDPSDILITNQPSSDIAFFDPNFYSPTSQVSVLSTHDLIAQLNRGPVEISTKSGFGGKGDITIDSNMDSHVGLGYATPYSLTLSADRDLVILASVQNGGDGDIICNVGRDLRIDGSMSNGPARLGSNLGNISINTGRHLLLIGGKNGQAQLGSDGRRINSNIQLTIGGDLVLQSTENFALVGHINTSGVSSANLKGDITIHSIGKDLIMSAQKGEDQFVQIGIASDPSSAPSNISGNVTIKNVAGSMNLVGRAKGYALIGHGGKGLNLSDIYDGKISFPTLGQPEILSGEFSGVGYLQDFQNPTTFLSFNCIPSALFNPDSLIKSICKNEISKEERSQIIISEMLTDLHPYDEYLGWFLKFQTSDEILSKKELYTIRMKNNFQNLPKNTLFTPFTETDK